MQHIHKIVAQALSDLTEQIVGLHSDQKHQPSWNDQIDRFVRRHVNHILSASGSNTQHFLMRMGTFRKQITQGAVEDFRVQPSEVLLCEMPDECKRRAQRCVQYLIDSVTQYNGGSDDTR